MEYEGEAVDATGEDSPTVDVGAGDAGLAFDPPALRVSTGTTVTWVRTGQGGGHNVVAEDGAFDSGGAVVKEGPSSNTPSRTAATTCTSVELDVPCRRRGRVRFSGQSPRSSATWSMRCRTRSGLPMSWRTRNPSSPATLSASSAISSAAVIESATPTTANAREVVV